MTKPAQAETGTTKKRDRIPLTIGTIAAVATPGAYLLGLSFYQGYMSAFGIEADGFPIAAPDVYVFSYQAIGYFLLSIGTAIAQAIDKLFSPPHVYWAAGLCLALVCGIYLFLRLSRRGFHFYTQFSSAKIQSALSWIHWKNNDFTKSIGIVGIASYGATLAAFAAVAITVFWWLLPLSANAKGREVATERIKSHLEMGCHVEPKTKWDTCFVVLNAKGNTIQEGLLIAVNDKEVAMFKKDGSYVFAREEGYLLRRTLHKSPNSTE